MENAIQSYKRFQFTEKYDTIVIGSGIGGLSAAAILAKEAGKKVLVLEQHYTAGGYTHVFKRRGYEWDVGIHYIGEVHRPNSELRRLFDYITDDKLKWAEMGEVYDNIFFGKEKYEFRKGKENFKAHLKTYFPDAKDQEAIDKYVALIYEAQGAGRLFFAEKALPMAVARLTGGMMRKKMMAYSRKTTLEVLQELTDNPTLIGVLAGQYGDYGLTPSESSFAMHAMVVKHYMNGASFPDGGCGQIAELTADVIAKSGGVVLTNARVAQIMVKSNKAVGVKMQDGREIFATTVISAAGFINTYKHLLHKEIQHKHGLQKQLNQVKPSVSHLGLYIGLQHTVEELGLAKPNYWIYPENGYNHDENVAKFLNEPETNDFPVVYVSFPAAKDPSWSKRYPNKSTIDIITLAPYEWFAEWENARWKKRGAEYEAFKERLAQRLLEKLYEYLPQLRGKIDYYELSTPLSTRHFCNYEKGEVYGLDHTPDRYEQRFLRVHTPIKQLYLTGQDVISAGIGGALAAGMITASAILRKDMSSKIKKIYQQEAT